MSDETQATANLRALRSALQAKRAEIADAARDRIMSQGAHRPDPSAGWQHGADLRIVQEQIEAVDRAIADELKNDTDREFSVPKRGSD
jgi:hypothetical protein